LNLKTLCRKKRGVLRSFTCHGKRGGFAQFMSCMTSLTTKKGKTNGLLLRCGQSGTLKKLRKYLLSSGLPRYIKLGPYVCSRCDLSKDSVYRDFKVNQFPDKRF
jgi:hypothetical protein